ncbi:hypothetical protein MKX01_009011, partial [Papaver californicum]
LSYSMAESSTATHAPKIGMLFKTADEAYDYYKAYGNSMGFSTCKNQRKTVASGSEVVRYAQFTCVHYGTKKTKGEDPINKPRASINMECPASIRIALVADGTCVDGACGD